MSKIDKRYPPRVLEKSGFQSLLESIAKEGYKIIGPVLRDGAVLYDELNSVEQLPIGWTDAQDAASYRVIKKDSGTLFGYSVGPHSWKRFLFPPRHLLWSANREGKSFEVTPNNKTPEKLAFLGVRPCELSAILVQDKVFLEGAYVDETYKTRRENTLIIAVNCGQAGGTCFCASMGTGPSASSGYDIVITEIPDKTNHRFILEAGSSTGENIMKSIRAREADDDDISQALEITEKTARSMGRSMDTNGLKELFYENYENARWDDVALRCLACANCTMVCPTCFCSTVEDVTDLSGDNAERWKQWDSCFTRDFSYIHGGSIRPSIKARYRQWIVHKLAAWIDQFGVSGCVGCGRCITWCPAAIDITEETGAIRGAPESEITPSD